MIDIHCHILPQFDDGARNLDESLEMAYLAHKSKINTIVATPHCNVPGEENNYYDDNYKKTFCKLSEALAENSIPVRLIPGMEVFVTFDLPNLIKDGKVITINNSRYILCEFGFSEEPEFIELMIKRIKELGLVPIIAHPERYDIVKYDIDFARAMIDDGALLQVNKSSFKQAFGRTAQKCAYELIRENLVSVIASDAHYSTFRTPYMLDLAKELESLCNTNTVFTDNPFKICSDIII